MVTEELIEILQNRFGMETVVSNLKIIRNGRQEAYQLLAYRSGEVNKGMVVEMKFTLDTTIFEQMDRKMAEVFDWLPEHRNKTFEGMVAYVHAEPAFEDELQKKILEKGWHLISMAEDVFEVEDPKGFVPTQYRYKKG